PEDAEAVDRLDEEEDDGDSDEKGENRDEEEKEDEVKETVARQLYLLDANGMVAAQTLELPQPESKEVATQAVEYLDKEGPDTLLLPTGIEAVLPEGKLLLDIDV